MPRKHEPIRWTCNRWAAESGIEEHTVSKRLKRAGILAGEDGLFSTKQMLAAHFGDIEGARLALTQAQTQGQELENGKLSGRLVDVPEFLHMEMPKHSAMRAAIMNANIAEEEKRLLLESFGLIYAVKPDSASSPRDKPILDAKAKA